MFGRGLADRAAEGFPAEGFEEAGEVPKPVVAEAHVSRLPGEQGSDPLLGSALGDVFQPDLVEGVSVGALEARKSALEVLVKIRDGAFHEVE